MIHQTQQTHHLQRIQWFQPQRKKEQQKMVGRVNGWGGFYRCCFVISYLELPVQIGYLLWLLTLTVEKRRAFIHSLSSSISNLNSISFVSLSIRFSLPRCWHVFSFSIFSTIFFVNTNVFGEQKCLKVSVKIRNQVNRRVVVLPTRHCECNIVCFWE